MECGVAYWKVSSSVTVKIDETDLVVGTRDARSVEVNGTLRLVNLKCNENLDDPSSQMFRNYTDHICSEVSKTDVIRLV